MQHQGWLTHHSGILIHIFTIFTEFALIKWKNACRLMMGKKLCVRQMVLK